MRPAVSQMGAGGWESLVDGEEGFGYDGKGWGFGTG